MITSIGDKPVQGVLMLLQADIVPVDGERGVLLSYVTTDRNPYDCRI